MVFGGSKNCQLRGNYVTVNVAPNMVFILDLRTKNAGLAQLVEQLICNQQVAGSSPIASSKKGFIPRE